MTIQNEYANRGLGQIIGDTFFIGSTERDRELYELIRRVAPTGASVLICGETGTGKRLVAKAIHTYEKSPTTGKPFLTMDCNKTSKDVIETALFGSYQDKEGLSKGTDTILLEQIRDLDPALKADLLRASEDSYVKRLESDLFGYKDKPGLFELANGGTILLYEIGNLPVELQAKLLRVLEDGCVRRRDEKQYKEVNLGRLICTTNKDIPKMVEQGSFIGGLHYKISVVETKLLPLRERRGKINIVKYFLGVLNDKHGKKRRLAIGAKDVLRAYQWPGNIPELENVIEGLVVSTRRNIISQEDVEKRLGIYAPPIEVLVSDVIQIDVGDKTFRESKEELEEKVIIEALKKTKGNVAKAARILEIARQNLHEKIKRYDINPKEYAIKTGQHKKEPSQDGKKTDTGPHSLSEAKKDLEKDSIEQALKETKGNITRAAEDVLGMRRQQLQRLMNKHGIDKGDYKKIEII